MTVDVLRDSAQYVAERRIDRDPQPEFSERFSEIAGARRKRQLGEKPERVKQRRIISGSRQRCLGRVGARAGYVVNRRSLAEQRNDIVLLARCRHPAEAVVSHLRPAAV
ncbi:MAG: hypothetical protein WDZ83_00315 [Rhizobiaceae bacterium]